MNMIPHQQPFTRRLQQWWRHQSRRQRIQTMVLGVIAILVICVIGWGVRVAWAAKTVYSQGQAARQDIADLQQALDENNLQAALTSVLAARDHIAAASDSFDSLVFFQIFPQFKGDIETTNQFLDAAKNLSLGIGTLAELTQSINQIATIDDSFANITTEQKHAILQLLSESLPDIQGAQANLQLGMLLLEEIPRAGLRPEFLEAITKIEAQAPSIDLLLHQALPAAQAIPSLAGYPNQKVYLILLQNPYELRPTGGFIGSYGILKVKDGDATFFIDNVYNLDTIIYRKPLSETEPPPGPIKHYIGVDRWYMRDANWAPDFPTTAAKVIQRYYDANGPEHIDGVIALDIHTVEDLMRFTGPITVKHKTYDADNLFELLESEVEFDYAKQGISDADRKKVIDTLAQKMRERLLDLPRSRWKELWQLFQDNAAQRHIQLYMADPTVQRVIEQQRWSGEMERYSGDFLAVFDANLGSLKTDKKMERTLSYTLNPAGDHYEGVAQMDYTNTQPTVTKEFFTRYRTYARFYLPQGSQLIEATGFLNGEPRLGGTAAQPDVYDDTFTRPDGSTVTYTVVGGFTNIEPAQSGSLRINYRLPDTITQQIAQGSYQLTVQKQAGTIAYPLHLSINAGKAVQSADNGNLIPTIADQTVTYTSDLLINRMIRIVFQ